MNIGIKKLNGQLSRKGRKIYKDTDERTEKSIREYLECEALMNEFFKEVNYCYPNCISQKKSKYRFSPFLALSKYGVRGDAGCCALNEHELCCGMEKRMFSFDPSEDRYLDLDNPRDRTLFKRLFLNYEKVQMFLKKREEKYGKPENNEEPLADNTRPCDYHTKDGCLLKDYKSPICISFLCNAFKNYLEENFGIYYDGHDEISMFKRLLNIDLDYDEVDDERVDDFKKMIRERIKKVKRKRSEENGKK